jgi:hypothetical protein
VVVVVFGLRFLFSMHDGGGVDRPSPGHKKPRTENRTERTENREPEPKEPEPKKSVPVRFQNVGNRIPRFFSSVNRRTEQAANQHIEPNILRPNLPSPITTTNPSSPRPPMPTPRPQPRRLCRSALRRPRSSPSTGHRYCALR